MNKKLRVLFCMLFAAIAVFALALVACDDDNSNTSTGSESSSTTDGTGSGTGGETHTHTYSSDPTVTWVEQTDGTYDLTVTLTCSDATCGETTSITATVTSEVTTAATKLAKGVRTYTGKYTYNGTDHTVTKEVEIPALATIYDAYYIEADATGFTESEYYNGQYTIAEDTSIFDGFATTSGRVYFYNTASETPETGNLTDGYTFQGYLNLSTSTTAGNGSLTFTLTSAATVTLYAKISANYNTLIVDSEGSTKATFKATSTTTATNVTPYSASLGAGTYSISISTGTSIYAIMLEGDDYTDGIWNYTASEAGGLEDNQFELVNSTEYTFTATEAGYYTFTIPSAGADIWAGEADYNDSSDGYTPAYINSSYSETSFEVYLEKDATIVLYLTNANSVVVTYTVSDTAKVVTTNVPTSLSTGNNGISLATADADTGISSTFTATIAGTYVFSTTDATAFMSVGSAYTAGVTTISADYPYTVTLAAGDTVTIYFYSYYEATESEYTLNIQLSATSDEVKPAALTIGGDTVATLDPEDSDSYYLLSYTVETAGYYTFTLSGTDLTYVDLTVYDRSGDWSTSSLSADKTTVTLLYGVGDTIKVYAYLTEGATDYVTFTLNIVKESTALSTNVPDTLEIGTAGNTIILSTDDAYDSYDVTYTATSTGLYTFSIDTGADAYIYVGNTSVHYWSSTYNNTSVTYYLAANEEVTIEFGTTTDKEAVYTFYITYSADAYDKLTVGEATTLTSYSSSDGKTVYAFATYTATTETAGNYYIALGFSSKTYVSSATITINDKEYTLTNYNCNITFEAGTTYSISIVYTLLYGSTITYTATLTSGTYVPVTTSINEVTDSENYALKEGDNAIALSSTDASSGVSAALAVSATGVYTFEIKSDANAKVTVGTTTLQVTAYTSTLTVSLYLEAGTNYSVTFKTYSGDEGTYTFTITKADTIDYQKLTAGTAVTLTKYTNGASSSSSIVTYAFVTFTATTETAGNYYIALTGSSSYWSSSLSSVTVTVNDGTAAEFTNYNYNLTLEAGTTYNIVITFGGNISNYYVYATLTSGTYEPLTTSINTGTENNGKIVAGNNNIVLSGDDASNGYVVTTFTASKDGVYTFTVDEDEDADVYIASSKDNYDSWKYSEVYSYSTEASVVLSSGDTLYIVLKTYSESEGKYTLTLEIGSITTATITTTDTELTLYTSLSGSYTYIAYATVTTDAETSGEYHIKLTDTDYDITDGYATVTVTVDGTAVSVSGGIFNITLAASTTYNIVITIVCRYADPVEYDYYAVLVSGAAIVSSIPTSLVVGTNTISVSASDASSYWGLSADYTLAAGTYTISIDTDGTSDAYFTCYSDDYTTVYSYYMYYDTATDENSSYTFTLTEETTIYFTFKTYSGSAATYNVYLSTGTAE